MSVSAQQIIDIIKKRGRGDPPSAISDLFLLPIVRTVTFIDAKIDFAQAQQTIDTILVLLEDEPALAELAGFLDETVEDLTTRLKTALEKIASNFGFSRRPASQSNGTVLVLRSNSLTVPPDSAITVPVGRRFFAPSINQEYLTTSTVIIATMIFDSDLQKFVFSVPVQSVNVGLATVAGASQISQVRNSIPGIEGVTNKDPVTGGRDEETDRELADRIKTALSANNIGTISGYRNLILSLFDVKDTSIVGAGDPFMLRDAGDGGSIDAYVTDPIPLTINELATALNFVPSGPNFAFSPSRQPLINDTATILPAINVVSINKDLGAFAGSIKARDTITFDADLTGQTITYQVNTLVKTVNDFVQDPKQKIVGADILVKEAQFVLVDIIITIQVLPEFVSARDAVRDNVQNAITQFIAALNIGKNLEQSDIVQVITNVAGVDRVNLPPTKFERSTNTGQINIISPLANEVLRPGSIIINF